MLVQFLLLGLSETTSGFDYEHCKVLSARKIKTYDKFIKYIKAMVHHDVIIEDQWYTIDSYALSFPSDHEMIPCLKVFVYEY